MIELRHLASALGCLVLTKDCRKATNKVEQQPVLSTELSGTVLLCMSGAMRSSAPFKFTTLMVQ